MTITAGIGSYEILSLLGAGGMGEVYRAVDSTLGREVAIKILPPQFAHDTERLARFEREARLLASLDHPNIGAIHGLDHANGVPFLVLELVPGATLAEILAAGPLSVSESLRIGAQVAEALESAHEKGIIHRDLKPANIKITPDGKVKVLDFGLAKAFGDNEAADPNRSPTISIIATRAGVILGTAAYMSPEQARGKPVDRRADVWSFGCVLYEALTGRRPFTGETVSHIIVSILEREPDWQALPPAVPVAVSDLLRRCLQKEVVRRLRDAGDARLILEEAQAAPALPHSPAAASPPRVPRAWLPWGLAALFLLSTLAVSLVHFREKAPDPVPFRFSIPPPEKASFSRRLAVSPDGRRVAFVASGADGRQLIWVRSFDSLESRALPGTENISAVDSCLIWSPDSRFLAFTDGAKLRKVEASGGSPQTICDVPAGVIGGAWNRGGVIVFGPNRGGLFRVHDSGGVPEPLTVANESLEEVHHAFTSFLPDGRHFVYLAYSFQRKNCAIYLSSLDTRSDSKDRKRLVGGIVGFAFAPSPDGSRGHLLYLRESTLMAQAFDTERLELAGGPFPVVDQIAWRLSYGEFSALPNVLVYRTGSSRGNEYVWFDRDGKRLARIGSGILYEVSLSPDGTRMAGSRQDPQTGNQDIWLHDLARASPSRFTHHASRDLAPVWSPDASRIAFASTREGPSNLYLKDSNSLGREELLLKSADDKLPNDWSRVGRVLLYSTRDPKTRSDLWVLPMTGDRKPIPFLRTEFNESQGQLSPDGDWVAYMSDESGKSEIYVQPFSAGRQSPGGKSIISFGGGNQPRWRANGKEIYYLSPDRKMMVVEIRTSPKLETGLPRSLFEAPIGPITNLHRYAVAPDGKRFLITTFGEETGSAAITVVLNWTAGSKQ